MGADLLACKFSHVLDMDNKKAPHLSIRGFKTDQTIADTGSD
jgi:hypothetical protein